MKFRACYKDPDRDFVEIKEDGTSEDVCYSKIPDEVAIKLTEYIEIEYDTETKELKVIK
jgi:hypothetical protein